MRPSYWSGREERQTDLLVIGGGFAGLTSAIACASARRGLQVTLIDRHGPGTGASGRNAGMVIPFPMIPLWLLPRSLQGIDARQANAALMGHLEAVLGGLIGTAAKPQRAEIVLAARSWFWSQGLKWIMARAAAMGVGHDRVEAEELRSRYSSGMPLAIRYPGWRVQPWEAAQHLASAAEAAGVEIVPGTEALQLVPEAGRVRVLTANGEIVAKQVLIATNAYGNGFGGRKAGITVFSYVLATGRLSDEQRQSLGGEAALYSELDTDIYRRVHDGRLVFGALDKLHRRADESWAADTTARAELRGMLAEHLPELAGVAIEKEWGGAFCQRVTAPIIAPHTSLPGVYFNTGYGGSGVSLTLLSGALVPGMLWPEVDTEATAMLRRAYAETRVPWLSLPGMAIAALAAR